MMVTTSLLNLLACPICKTALSESAESLEVLACASCNVTYPVIEGIPVLLADQAQATP
ncbi:MAG: Trm112 family protein [Actinobacteria bacterium]|nr:Trm112 family protein [Actinomycetota bacterium]MSZ49186.1 Trm112 family protein [Actinomycetota bacterium]MTA97416.1 Trm112 family protein [Actinomycetota bacterium]